MAAFETTRPDYGSASAVNGIHSILSRVLSAVVAWNDARVTQKALSALSDRELEDIGLNRGDIDHIAHPGFYR